MTGYELVVKYLSQLRFLGSTDLFGEWAPWMEGATRRRVNHARRFSQDLYPEEVPVLRIRDGEGSYQR